MLRALTCWRHVDGIEVLHIKYGVEDLLSTDCGQIPLSAHFPTDPVPYTYLQTSEVRLREVKKHSKCCTAFKGQSWDLNLSFIAL